jgi:uncharacterized protein YcsI (UPF0317 family)
MTQTNATLPPSEARRQFRDGLVTPTSGWSDGYTQTNLIAVTADYADEFLEFCRLNPKPCPVIDVIPAGQYESSLAKGSDIRTDIPAYRVLKDAVLAAEIQDVRSLWRDDMVGVLIGCSFTFEAALPPRASRSATPRRGATSPCTVRMSSAHRQGGSTARWSSRCGPCRPTWWTRLSG